MYPILILVQLLLSIGELLMKIITTTRKNGSRRVQIETSRESNVEQAHAGATDINAIVRKYLKTGEMAQNGAGGYGDFTGAEDFHSTQNRIIAANEHFMALPSDLRSRFDNDPGQFLTFMNDDSNTEEAIELGLIHDPKIKPDPPLEESKPAEKESEPPSEPDKGGG